MSTPFPVNRWPEGAAGDVRTVATQGCVVCGQRVVFQPTVENPALYAAVHEDPIRQGFPGHVAQAGRVDVTGTDAT